MMDNKSRMSREAHVRFCEKLGVKLPWLTRPSPATSLTRYSGFDKASNFQSKKPLNKNGCKTYNSGLQIRHKRQ